MAADLKRQRAELERTHRLEAWADMARQVAHDIKNPLTPIQLSAEHLQPRPRRPRRAAGRRCSTTASTPSSARCGCCARSRRSSRASPRRRPRSPAAMDVPELVAEVVEPYRTGLAGRIVIANEVAAPLPARVSSIARWSRRALTNVIENALHAMPGRARLTIARGSADDRVRPIARRPTPASAWTTRRCERIFEPYFSTKATGTGLGLTIASRNIELNGGRVDVESARGVGTTVILRLPVLPDHGSHGSHG